MVDNTLDGNYRIVRLIGGGGMGSVYQAETIDTGLRVAIKVICSQYLASNKSAVRRFRREAPWPWSGRSPSGSWPGRRRGLLRALH